MSAKSKQNLKMYLIPCSCGTSFAVSEQYDAHGSHLRAFLVCPGCGKRHDPRNRLLQLGYQKEGYWKVDGC
jgi:hydrogenase maturation factor HypF (carbamoyltransferase family)